ncbi:OPT oligopeptide transporter [Mycena floridula]|nr:OPT oligopeptide transporter [Mycena floridula]
MIGSPPLDHALRMTPRSVREASMGFNDIPKSSRSESSLEEGKEWECEIIAIARSRTSVSTRISYFDDPNLDKDYEGFQLDDESPYPEVRSAVSNTDDPSMPAATLRAWIIGLVLAMAISGTNQLFIFRFPSVDLTGIVAQLIAYPIGRAAAAYLPRCKIFGIEVNPGPFSIKEHVLITIMASVGSGSAYATGVLAVQKVYYKHSYSFAYQWFLVMSTQLIGFSMGGIAHRVLVAPASMIWPSNLVTCSLFNTLHSSSLPGIGARGGLSRERFFWYAFAGSFVWYFFPGYLFQALSYFSWVTWIWPDSPVVAQLFGYVNGMGMSVITFDWCQIAYIGSPLATPFWSQLNVIAGFLAFYWILTPILHFTNTWYGQHMPILSSSSFDNELNPYNVSRILNPDYTFNREAYENYSPLLLGTGFAVSYGLSFAAIAATLTHCFIYFRKQIWRQSCKSMDNQEDIHARLMSRYPQIPHWWYMAIFSTMFTLGVLSIELWPTQMPVWAFVLALAIAFLYVIPAGMVQAITNQQVGLNVITELIIGYALPGHPVAMMMFKTWGYVSMVQALTFTSDLKLGHYMKIPPRQLFCAQVAASIVAGTTQLGVQTWMLDNIHDICTPRQKDGFTCQSIHVFGTASVIWGVIGPELQFSKGHIYYRSPLLFCFIIGGIAPFIPWLIGKKYPNSWTRYVNSPVVFMGTNLIPPATAINFVPWAIVGWFFQSFLRRRRFSWWTKYNYILSAALDSGLAFSIIVIFFALQYPRNGTMEENSILSWWGNTVFTAGADGQGIPIKQLAPGDKFGPSKWV